MKTLRDVAKLAQVSVTTASYALNDRGTISDETRQRVLKAAEMLNYHPHAAARHLKQGKTLTIGVFITRFGGQFYDEILEGIHHAVLRTDYELIVCPETHSVSRLLTQRQVDGAIVFDSKTHSDTLLKLANPQFPIVVMDRWLDSPYILPLLLDNAQGAQEAFDHLYTQGARRIAFVSGADNSLDSHERQAAFLAAATAHGLTVTCHAGNFTEQAGHAVGMQLGTHDALPEAVFCANDQMAIGLVNALLARGVQVPHDVAVIGFDDIHLARYMRPTLSTIGTSRVEWGGAAVRHLLTFLEAGGAFPPARRMRATLVVRQSSRRLNDPQE